MERRKIYYTFWHYLGFGIVGCHWTVLRQFPQLSSLAARIRAELDDGGVH